MFGIPNWDQDVPNWALGEAGSSPNGPQTVSGWVPNMVVHVLPRWLTWCPDHYQMEHLSVGIRDESGLPHTMIC